MRLEGEPGCESCAGNGSITCAPCMGTGVISVEMFGKTSSCTCHLCGGRKTIPCPVCKRMIYRSVVWWKVSKRDGSQCNFEGSYYTDKFVSTRKTTGLSEEEGRSRPSPSKRWQGSRWNRWLSVTSAWGRTYRMSSTSWTNTVAEDLGSVAYFIRAAQQCKIREWKITDSLVLAGNSTEIFDVFWGPWLRCSRSRSKVSVSCYSNLWFSCFPGVGILM